MDISNEMIRRELSNLPLSISKNAETYIEDILNKAGVYYRVFARTKSAMSTINKMKKKSYGSTKKLQDILGVRVVLYFKDDIYVCVKLLKQELDLVDESIDREEVLEPGENSHTKTSRNDHLKSRRNSQCNSEEIAKLYSAIAEPIINLLITLYFLAL